MTMKLLKAAENGDIAALEKRLLAGDDIGFVQKGTGLNALTTALHCGNLDAAQWLIENSSPLDELCKVMGWTAAGWAASNGQEQGLQMLKEAGADLDKTQDAKGRTPYLIAVDFGKWDAVRWFWSADVDFLRRDARGMTAHDLLLSSQREVPPDLLERAAADAAKTPDRSAAANPFDGVQPWPDEPWAQLHWPEDFPALPAQYDEKAVADGTDKGFFDEAFHQTMAEGLAPALASPTAAVRSWVWTQSHWEREAREAVDALSEDDLPAFIAEYQRQMVGGAMIRHAFLHPRARRAHPARLPDWVSIHEELQLLHVQPQGANKVEVAALAHRPLSAGADQVQRLKLLEDLQELRFTVMCSKTGKAKDKMQSWRVDAVEMRIYSSQSVWTRLL